MKSKKLILILIVLLILVAIGALWMFKNRPDNQAQRLKNASEAAKAEDVAGSQLTIGEFNLSKLVEAGLPIMVDFGSQTCPPCLMMAGGLKRVYTKLKGKAVVHYVDITETPDAANGLPISVTPTQLFFNPDGSPYSPSSEISEQFDFTLYSYRDTGEHAFTAHMGMLSEAQMLLILSDMGVIL